MAELVLHRGGEALLRLPVEGRRIRLGRGPENDVVLPDAGVAREQALLERRTDGWWLIDRSGEGTGLEGGGVVRDAPLADGATLRLGGAWGATFWSGETHAVRGGGHTMVREATPFLADALRLRWRDPDGARALVLDGQAVELGTDPDNGVVLDDPFASSFHARLEPWQGRWRLRDLDSTNGTWLEGVQVAEALLAPGMTFRVGTTDVHFEIDRPAPEAPAHGVLTGDPDLLRILEQLARIAASDATVTIFGESGTGKELAARLVHDASPRATGPFIPVNCAAISKELMESELFGHERGAFTGAAQARRGAFEEAAGGTLFLDEVGELPLDLQAKLLRALELKEVRRVGSSRPLQVDVRIVCATNRDLHAEVRAGRFREDLFYRLFVVPVTLPPLRRRRGDVLRLAEHFIETRALRRPVPALAPAARDKLQAHPWPGNVRELRNTLERALLLYGGDRIEAEDVQFAEPTQVSPEDGLIDAVGKTMAEVEREAIRIALKTYGGNRRLTARGLGIARSTLQLRLKEMGLVGSDAED